MFRRHRVIQIYIRGRRALSLFEHKLKLARECYRKRTEFSNHSPSKIEFHEYHSINHNQRLNFLIEKVSSDVSRIVFQFHKRVTNQEIRFPMSIRFKKLFRLNDYSRQFLLLFDDVAQYIVKVSAMEKDLVSLQ